MGFTKKWDHLDQTISERCDAMTTPISQQLQNSVSVMKLGFETAQQGVQQQLEAIQASGQELGCHLKSAKEEMAALKKVHEDHVRCLSVERESRLRQMTEVRSDVAKMLAKEHDDRVADGAEQRANVSKTLREWEVLKSTMTAPAATAISTKKPSLFTLHSTRHQAVTLSMA